MNAQAPVETAVTPSPSRNSWSRSTADSIPDAVYAEATRTFLNWLGCAVGGATHPAIDIAWAAAKPFAGATQASILGRDIRTDALHAALINGISSHVFDFDDTHLKTIIHPAGPVASGLLALAEKMLAEGRTISGPRVPSMP